MANTPMVRKNFMDGGWTSLPLSYSAGGGPAAEVDTGFALPQNCAIYPWEMYLLVDTAETTGAKTLGVGILSTQANGNATGFFAAISTASTGLVKPTVTLTQGTNAHYISATTYGVLFLAAACKGANTAEQNAVPIFTPYISDGTAMNISYTVVTASVAFVGRLIFRVHEWPV